MQQSGAQQLGQASTKDSHAKSNAGLIIVHCWQTNLSLQFKAGTALHASTKLCRRLLACMPQTKRTKHGRVGHAHVCLPVPQAQQYKCCTNLCVQSAPNCQSRKHSVLCQYKTWRAVVQEKSVLCCAVCKLSMLFASAQQ